MNYQPFMNYYQLLKKPVEDLSAEEQKQLERASAIPPNVRKILEAKVTELRGDLRKIEEEIDEITDFLNGFEYEEKVPF